MCRLLSLDGPWTHRLFVCKRSSPASALPHGRLSSARFGSNHATLPATAAHAVPSFSTPSMSMIFTNKLVLSTYEFNFAATLLVVQSAIAVASLKLLAMAGVSTTQKRPFFSLAARFLPTCRTLHARPFLHRPAVSMPYHAPSFPLSLALFSCALRDATDTPPRPRAGD